jgi:hypothetical protein
MANFSIGPQHGAGASTMAFVVEQASDDRTFRLTGELDLASSAELIRQLQPSLGGDGDIRLDLARLQFMDSSDRGGRSRGKVAFWPSHPRCPFDIREGRHSLSSVPSDQSGDPDQH